MVDENTATFEASEAHNIDNWLKSVEAMAEDAVKSDPEVEPEHVIESLEGIRSTYEDFVDDYNMKYVSSQNPLPMSIKFDYEELGVDSSDAAKMLGFQLKAPEALKTFDYVTEVFVENGYWEEAAEVENIKSDLEATS